MLKIGLINKPALISDPNNPHPSSPPYDLESSNFQDHYQYQFPLPQAHPSPPLQHPPGHQVDVKDLISFVDGHQLVPKNSVLAQVEKVIEVIRRRRSVKAIETPQQVHFIIQYANWLDSLTENLNLFLS